MEQPPALTPQEISNMQQHMLGQPQTVKILGIFHVIFAAYGFFGSALAIVMAFVGNPFMKLMPKTPELAKQMEMQAQMQEKMMPATIISTAVTLIITALILIAGIKLLKKRRSGLTWSNRYAWTSLAGKLVNLILAFVYTIPIMREATMGHSLPGGAGAIMQATMIGGAIGGVLVMCTYPILTLVLLNRPRTKEWFAAQPD